MPFAAALSTAPAAARALDEVVAAAFDGTPDLAVVFFSPHHAAAAAAIGDTLKQRLRPRALLGCVGESIVGNGQEIEGQPALSLWLARWNAPVRLEPFHVVEEQTPDGPSFLGWPDSTLGGDPATSIFLVLGDPFSFRADAFLRQVNDDHKGLRVVGGMASGVRGPRQARLLLDGKVLDHGAIGVSLEGLPGVRSVVSQGCRPIGRHMVVTRGHDNVIEALGGKPPLHVLQELWPELTVQEQELFQKGLHVGLVLNEYQGEFRRGDFLVRNVLGVERESGAMAITDRIRVGQTVQFHVRDAATADEDLRLLLQHDRAMHATTPGGALLFTCNGRGSRLFETPHHDADAVQTEVAAIPTAGFFAQGELGPVGGQNFIHGFTASVVLFEG